MAKQTEPNLLKHNKTQPLFVFIHKIVNQKDSLVRARSFIMKKRQ